MAEVTEDFDLGEIPRAVRGNVLEHIEPMNMPASFSVDMGALPFEATARRHTLEIKPVRVQDELGNRAELRMAVVAAREKPRVYIGHFRMIEGPSQDAIERERSARCLAYRQMRDRDTLLLRIMAMMTSSKAKTRNKGRRLARAHGYLR
jgi:hypothetical protein